MESYRILYRIKVEHGYFDGEPCPALQCRLTPQGEVLARRRGMLFRQTAPGEWTLLFHTRPAEDDILMLDLSICDSGFTLYTAWSGFRPSADYMLELPRKEETVEAATAIRLSGKKRTIRSGFCTLSLRLTNGMVEAAEKGHPMQVILHFKEATVQWEYLFIPTGGNAIPSGRLQLEDTAGKMAFTAFKDCEAYGRKAIRTRSRSRIPMRPAYGCKLRLTAQTEGKQKRVLLSCIDPTGITDEPDVTAPPASGLLPGMEGLHTAVVKKLDGDPAGEYRIQVELPWLEGEGKLLWARLSTLYATDASGSFWLPEPGDEVLLGFVNNDPARPVILGSLYGSKHKPPFEYEAENNRKALVTREQLKIEFDEEKKIITVSTPGNNKVELSDDGKSVTLSDANGNEVKMDKDGITLSSAKDIKLSAKGNITMDATMKLSGTAKQDISLEGLNVKVQAKVGATVKGNATAELSASGQTTVKGAMVMIN